MLTHGKERKDRKAVGWLWWQVLLIHKKSADVGRSRSLRCCDGSKAVNLAVMGESGKAGINGGKGFFLEVCQ